MALPARSRPKFFLSLAPQTAFGRLLPARPAPPLPTPPLRPAPAPRLWHRSLHPTPPWKMALSGQVGVRGRARGEARRRHRDRPSGWWEGRRRRPQPVVGRGGQEGAWRRRSRRQEVRAPHCKLDRCQEGRGRAGPLPPGVDVRGQRAAAGRQGGAWPGGPVRYAARVAHQECRRGG